MNDELHYTHHCDEHGAWTDTNQFSVCPHCGEEDIEEIADEEWKAMAEIDARDAERMSDASLDCFDSLRLCVVCGDAETTAEDSICHRCAHQRWIDEHG